MSQKELSVTSGAPLSSIQRFEHTGEVSLSSFAKIVRFLGYAKELMEVISKPKYQSIEEREVQMKNFSAYSIRKAIIKTASRVCLF